MPPTGAVDRTRLWELRSKDHLDHVEQLSWSATLNSLPDHVPHLAIADVAVYSCGYIECLLRPLILHKYLGEFPVLCGHAATATLFFGWTHPSRARKQFPLQIRDNDVDQAVELTTTTSRSLPISAISTGRTRSAVESKRVRSYEKRPARKRSIMTHG